MFSDSELKDMIARHVGPDRVPRIIRLISDTSDFFRVEYDDVVILGEKPYFIRHNEREGRFGIEEQQKFWVKRAVDLSDGSVKIIKLTFLERFVAKVGELSFECYRSPKKEARILDLVKGDKRFMQGISIPDIAGNIVRVIEYIQGKTLADSVLLLGRNHEDYFYHYFPAILDEFIELAKAIKFLHDNGEKHGDIRRDHIIKEKNTGICRWIDFDFNYLHKENLAGYDLFGLGNVIVYLAGRGDVISRDLKVKDPPAYQKLTDEDLNIIFNSRVVNLRKVYPYVSNELNHIFLHFSSGANVFYENVEQFLQDILAVRNRLWQ
jgi:hypothetical protein